MNISGLKNGASIDWLSKRSCAAGKFHCRVDELNESLPWKAIQRRAHCMAVGRSQAITSYIISKCIQLHIKHTIFPYFVGALSFHLPHHANVDSRMTIQPVEYGNTAKIDSFPVCQCVCVWTVLVNIYKKPLTFFMDQKQVSHCHVHSSSNTHTHTHWVVNSFVSLKLYSINDFDTVQKLWD